MMGSLLSRTLVLLLGYAYPAYECYKTVELNKPQIEQLRFWCQYWILIALLAVLERFGDTFISWLPMYSEAKVAFYIYLWCPRTRGTTYVYETFFRPYMAKHEMEIDRNLLELKTRAGDLMLLNWQRAASYSQTRFFEVLHYVTSQSQASKTRPMQQHQQPEQLQHTKKHQAPSMAPPASQPDESQKPENQRPSAAATATQPASQQPSRRAALRPIKGLLQEQPTKSSLLSKVATSSESCTSESNSTSSGTNSHPLPTVELMQLDTPDSLPPVASHPAEQQTPIEEAMRVTRARLRRRAAIGARGGGGGSSRS